MEINIKKERSSPLMCFSFHDRDIFTIHFTGKASQLLKCLEMFEESITSPYFGRMGELWDED